MGIAAGLGKPLRVDMATLKFQRGRFVRICVEVELRRPLQGAISVNGGRHIASNCHRRKTLVPETGVDGGMVVEVPSMVESDKGNCDNVAKNGRETTTEINGPPTVAGIAIPERQVEKILRSTNRENPAKIVTTNRFAGLGDILEVDILASNPDGMERNIELKGKDKVDPLRGLSQPPNFKAGQGKMDKPRAKKQIRPTKGLILDQVMIQVTDVAQERGKGRVGMVLIGCRGQVSQKVASLAKLSCLWRRIAPWRRSMYSRKG
ncbi:hypothetical protein V2J09_022370 [Rumex salicifolius]